MKRFVVALLCTACARVLGPPVTPARLVTTTYQGISVTDPYRYLENLSDPKVSAWVAATGDYTRRQLDRIPSLRRLLRRVDELEGMVPVRIARPLRTPSGRVFYLGRTSDEPLAKLYVRQGMGGAETLLFAPEEGVPRGLPSQAINIYTPSPDGKHVALVTAPADAELGVMRVREVDSRRDVGAPIPSIWGELGAIWEPDGKSFYYIRTLDVGSPNANVFQHQRVFRRALAGGDDVPVFGWQVAGAPAARANDWPFLLLSAGSPYAVGVLSEGVNSPARLFVTERAKLGSAAPGWRAVTEDKDGVRDYAAAGSWLYVKSFVGASRFHILRYDLSAPGTPAVEVVPEQAGVIEQLGAAQDGLYYVVRQSSASEIFHLPHRAGPERARRLPLPYAGAVDLPDAHPDLPGALFMLDAWTRARQLFSASPEGVQNTGLIAAGSLGSGDDLLAEDMICKGHDGAKVPMTVVGPRARPRDRSTPVLLNGYGGYGFTITAHLEPRWRAWYELGGRIAFVNPRGSGAYGEAWYRAGMGPTKPNTWKDMIACAEALIAAGHSSPATLGIVGTSMGGVAVGRAVTERPDLFRVAFMRVGVLDAIRFIEATSNGPNHELEMGTLQSPAGVRALLEMSSYHHVRDGVGYPAVLLTHGLNDNRVAPWISMKMAARLQAATGSGRPVLLRTEKEGGHGMTVSADKRTAEWADEMAFHLWSIGHPDFQPRPE
jgi:prolyl oligopeptidase